MRARVGKTARARRAYYYFSHFQMGAVGHRDNLRHQTDRTKASAIPDYADGGSRTEQCQGGHGEKQGRYLVESWLLHVVRLTRALASLLRWL